MESWENKIMREKMDSLQDLPAGYAPNLASKWEIIEAGLPQQKKRVVPLLVRLSVAAAIIAAMFLIGIKINQNNKAQQAMLASVKIPATSIPIAVQKEQAAVVIKPTIVKKNILQKAVKPIAAIRIETVAKQDKEQLVKDKPQVNQLIPMIDSAFHSNDELATTIPQPEPTKRTKRRTFQKDFNDELLVMDTGYSKPASPQLSFKLQLHKSTGDEAQPSRRLQLKQVL